MTVALNTLPGQSLMHNIHIIIIFAFVIREIMYLGMLKAKFQNPEGYSR